MRPYSIVDTPLGPIERDAAIPFLLAQMFIGKPATKIPELKGICTTPILRDDGSIHMLDGYDPASKYLFAGLPKGLESLVPSRPSMGEAEAQLDFIRRLFRTIPFGDGPKVSELILGKELKVVDLKRPPALSESVFLTALMTIVVYRSLPRVPGFLLRAPSGSGSGAGKGQIVVVIITVSGAISVFRTSRGEERSELDKRIVAGLLSGAMILALDNINDTILVSEQLAVAMSEDVYDLRPLGTSKTRRFNGHPFIVATGNGLELSNDLARRFLRMLLDPGVDDAESREFEATLAQIAKQHRTEIMAAVLTIWRWGVQGCDGAPRVSNKTLGSYERWSGQVCRPLVALGCTDPVLSVAESKKADPRREAVSFVFRKWHHHHGSAPMRVGKLHYEVIDAMNLKSKHRNTIRGWLGVHVDQVEGGLQLRCVRRASRYGTDVFSILWIGDGDAPVFDADGEPVEPAGSNKGGKGFRRRK